MARRAAGQSGRVLHRADERQRGLGALVEVRAGRRQAVVAAVRVDIPHHWRRRRCGRRTIRSRGRCLAAIRRHPSPRAHVHTRRPSRRPRSAADRTVRLPSPRPAPPTGVGERCPSTALTVEEPAQQREPVVEDVGAIEDMAGSDERLRQRGVGVGQSRLRPRPVRLGRQRSDRRDRVGEQVAGSATVASSCSATSAAPRAANAIARRWGDRCFAPWSKYDDALERIPGSSARRAAVPNAQRLRPQQSSTP